MTRPVRLQLSRTKGFSLKALSQQTNGLEVINVARPGKWGNPFVIGQYGPFDRKPIDNKGAVGFFSDMFHDDEMWRAANYPTDFCHADILLEIANK